jgi:hypothetical protein
MKLTTQTQVTVDGVMQGNGGATDEDRRNGFERAVEEIVVGSRGFGRVRGVLGSVSHAVLHEADRPVVVIPADAVSGPDRSP